jgi:hypothetical protein
MLGSGDRLEVVGVTTFGFCGRAMVCEATFSMLEVGVVQRFRFTAQIAEDAQTPQSLKQIWHEMQSQAVLNASGEGVAKA